MKTFFSRFGLALLFLFLIAINAPQLNKEIKGHHAWRQAQTQTNIQNFYSEDGNILNPRVNLRPGGKGGIYRREFPLYQWCSAQLMHVFGNQIWVSRAISFVLFLSAVLAVFYSIRLLLSDKILALISSTLFAFSPALLYFSISPLPDLAALVFMIWSFFFFCHPKPNQLKFLIGAIFFSLSVAVKLPFVVLIGFPLLILLQNRKWSGIILLVLALLPALYWYYWVIPSWTDTSIQKGILQAVFKIEDLKLLLYQITDLLPLKALGAAMALTVLAGSVSKSFRQSRFLWPVLLGLSGCLFFLVYDFRQIAKAHDYYLFPFIPPSIVLAAYGLNFIQSKWTISRWILGGLILIQMSLSTLELQWKRRVPSHVNTAWYASIDELRESIPADARVIVGYDKSPHIFLYYVQRKGAVVGPYGFSYEKLKEEWMKYEYAILDDQKAIDALSLHDEQLVDEINGIKVYRLK